MGIDSLVLVSNYRTDESSEVFGRSQAIISNTIVLVLGRTTRIDLSIYLSPSPTLVFFYRFRQQAGENFSKPRIPMPTKG